MKSKANLIQRPAYSKTFLRRLWADCTALGVQSKQIAALADVKDAHVCNVRAGRRTSARVIAAAIKLRDAARVEVA